MFSRPYVAVATPCASGTGKPIGAILGADPVTSFVDIPAYVGQTITVQPWARWSRTSPDGYASSRFARVSVPTMGARL